MILLLVHHCTNVPNISATRLANENDVQSSRHRQGASKALRPMSASPLKHRISWVNLAASGRVRIGYRE